MLDLILDGAADWGLTDLEYREILQLKIASVCPDQIVGKVAKMS